MLKKEEKKQMILKAAAECFSKNGYDKTTLDEIGHKVSLNKATLYYYYSSLPGIGMGTDFEFEIQK